MSLTFKTRLTEHEMRQVWWSYSGFCYKYDSDRTLLTRIITAQAFKGGVKKGVYQKKDWCRSYHVPKHVITFNKVLFTFWISGKSPIAG